MLKRPSDTPFSSQRLSQSAPFKRAKREPTPEVMVVDDGLSSIPDSSSEAEEPVAAVRDPEFYYEDGSITFRVGDVLFKVHASLLKIESKDFDKKFDVPPMLAEATKPRGTCDENPIIIPDAKASQFRNLVELIYRPHYLNVSAYNANAWQLFVFYLNIVRLANRFGMNRIEKWARPLLARLVRVSGKKVSAIADEVSRASESDEDEDEDGDEESVKAGDADTVDDASERRNEGMVGEPITAVGVIGDAPYDDVDFLNPIDFIRPINPTNPNPSQSSRLNLNNTSSANQPNNHNDANKSDQVNDSNEANTADNASSSSRSSDEGDSDKEDEEDDDEEMDEGESKDEIVLPPEEEVYPVFQLLDALFYAESVSDSSLQYDVRNVLQHHCVDPEYLPVDTLVNLFKVPDLQEIDSAMFGFLFIVLLDQGNQVWKQDIFTRMDRMAFFSAQSYLTPFPDSLKTFVAVPLFNKPISAKSFATIFSDASTEKSCVEECFTKAFVYWEEQFDEAYYADMANKGTLAPIKALVTLPRRRLDLAEKLLASKCEHECYLKLLSQVDRDVQGLYARLADYYQGIE
ncbi:hypothetical protein RSOL_116550 [Rhizoctonia solani AG-3 Rhs1AP]|uniref:BTB domain-containing protein n=1 Tax=Rhizoctonia solani AG-3 Rhs1AP TaxID=1086054 RepID=X8IZC3_9AGAM|nr:hypothetical protein RSOL_116550 [Rhizoctonia solani AG-3 Rhs1AP]